MKFLNPLFIALLAVGIPFDGDAQQLAPAVKIEPAHTSFVNDTDAHHLTLAVSKMAPERVSPEWETLDGEWVYVSNYTGKCYPSRVRRQSVADENGNVTEIKLEVSNEFFGTAIIRNISETGFVTVADINGSSLVQLPDTDGNGEVKYIYSIVMPQNNAPANRFQYAASRYIKLAVNIVGQDASTGQPDYNNASEVTYDYLYDTTAQTAGINVEVPRYADGPLTLTGVCGKEVADLYCVLELNNRNEQEAQENPELAGRGWSVDLFSMPKMLAEYMAGGKTNPAVTIAKVGLSETGEFTTTLSERWNGVRNLSLYAFNKDGEMVSQKYAVVEMHDADGWKPYKNITISYLMPDVMAEGAQDRQVNKQTTLEINETVGQMRIVNPFSDVASDGNYIYIDYSLGRDKCYVTGSYAPATYTYTFLNEDFTKSPAVTEPYHLCSFVSTNMSYGFTAEALYETFADTGWFFDLTAEAPRLLMFLQDDNRYYWHDGVYVNGSFEITMALSDVASISFADSYQMNVDIGADIAKVDYTFINKANEAESSRRFSISNVGDAKYSIDLLDMLFYKRIPSTANAVRYAFYNKAGDVVKEGILDIPFDMSIDVAYVDFTPATILNSSGPRRCSYSTSTAGNPCVTLYDFSQSEYYTGANYGAPNTLEIEFVNGGTPVISRSYYGVLSFDTYGDCDLYIEAYNSSLDQNVVKTGLSWIVYKGNESTGVAGQSKATITLPADYVLNAGIEGVTSVDRELPAEYFNLQGIRVASPQSGNVYIERRGGSARKVLF